MHHAYSKEDLIFCHSREFLCRDWVFSKLQHCIDTRAQAKTCGVLIMGGPGCGKTAVCREIVRPTRGGPSKQHRLRSELLAYHFCIAQDVDSLNLPRFILNLRDQIIASESVLGPAYKALLQEEEIGRLFCPARLCNSPDEAFKRGILLPLLSLQPPPGHKFILIDSIDESCFLAVNESQQGSKNVAEILATHHQFFPEWLTLVCTCRKQSKSVIRFFTGFRKISLDDLRKSHVIRDVQQYILARLDSEEGLRQHLSQETADMLNLLHIKSNACILYLETVLDGIAEHFVMLREIVDIPGTLNGLYLWLCQRLFPKQNFEAIRDCLNVMLAAAKPLSEEELFAAVWMRDTSLSWNCFTQRLGLLHRVVTRTTVGALLLFHHSFAEWLLDVKHCTQTFLCSAPEGHTLLALAATRRAGELKPEETRGLAHHLVRSSLEPPFQATHLVLWLTYSGAELDTALLPAVADLDDWQLDGTAEKLLLAAGAGPASGGGSLPQGCHWDVLQDRFNTLQLDCLMSTSQVYRLDRGMRPSSSGLTTASPHEDMLAALLPCSPPASVCGTLCMAAYQGNLSSVGLLLAQGMEVDVRDGKGCTPIILAARQGNVSVVQLLVRAGASMDHVDKEGWSALRSAAWGGHLDVVEVLLSAGASPNLAGLDLCTALRAAAWGGHEMVARRLLAAGADVNLGDIEGRTPLIAAAYMGFKDIVELLINNGADLDQVDREGRSAVSVCALCMPASDSHALTLTTLLERGASVDTLDDQGVTPLLFAARDGRREVCELLLDWDAQVDHTDHSGRSPLMAAASFGHADVVQVLLFWGAAIHGMDTEGRSVLSMAVQQGNSEVVAELLARGLDETHRDNSGMTPLHIAALEGHLDAARLLIEAGARPGEVDNEGQTPVLLACQEGHFSLISFLLDVYPAALEVASHDGRTPLRIAALDNNRQLVQYLMARGVNLNKQDGYGRTTLYMVALEGLTEMAQCLVTCGPISRPTDPCLGDEEGRCPLHVAAWQGHGEVVRCLLKAATPVNAKDREGRTALHSAAWQGHVAVCLVLLEAGAAVDAFCSQGATSLCIAAQEGHLEVGRVLLQHDANPNHADAYGRTPHRVALKAGHLAVCRLLEEHGASPGSSLTRATLTAPGHTHPTSSGGEVKRPNSASKAVGPSSLHSAAPIIKDAENMATDFSPYASPPLTLDSGTGSDRRKRGHSNRRQRHHEHVLQVAANLMLANGSAQVQAARAAHMAINGDKCSPSSENSEDVWGSEGSIGWTRESHDVVGGESGAAEGGGCSVDPIYHSVYAGLDGRGNHVVLSDAEGGKQSSSAHSRKAARDSTPEMPTTDIPTSSSGSNLPVGSSPARSSKPTVHLIVNPGEVINLSEMTDSEYEDPVWIIQQTQQKHNSRPYHQYRHHSQHHSSGAAPTRGSQHRSASTAIIPAGHHHYQGKQLFPEPTATKTPGKKGSGGGKLGSRLINGYMNISRRLQENSGTKKSTTTSVDQQQVQQSQLPQQTSASTTTADTSSTGRIKIETPL